MTTLATILERLKDNESLLSHGEEGTRQVAILPVLAALGWDRDDLNEVEPEHPVGTGRVDYCLRHQNRSTVFIEVKRTGTDLEPHQQQLLNYAFQEGVSLAVLTDGLVWWLYLPREGGSWEQRKFFSVDCRVLAPDGAAEALERYLQREAVLAGTAQERAIAELKGQQRNQRTLAVLPDVWEKLITEPDEHLLELVSKAVEGAAGHWPDPDLVAAFLLQVRRPTEPPTALAGQMAADTLQREPKNLKNRKPAAFILDEQRYSVTKWREMLVELCNLLAAEAGASFEHKVLPIRGTKRPYFAKEPAPLREPVPIGAGLFVDGFLDANSYARLMRRIVRAVRGTDAAFRIEVLRG